MPNFSSLAGLEVPEKFMVVGGFQVSTMSNPTNLLLSCFSWVELSWVTLGFDNKYFSRYAFSWFLTIYVGAPVTYMLELEPYLLELNPYICWSCSHIYVGVAATFIGAAATYMLKLQSHILELQPYKCSGCCHKCWSYSHIYVGGAATYIGSGATYMLDLQPHILEL